MAKAITLQEAKDHLRVTGSVEDTKIQGYIDAADDHILNYLNAATFLDDSPVVYPSSVKQAACIIVAAFYVQQPIPVSV
jgi:hypothetical protein